MRRFIPLPGDLRMHLVGHITMYEVSFVVAMFLFGLMTGYTLGWKRSEQPAREKEPRR
jgi:hypothetical protein